MPRIHVKSFLIFAILFLSVTGCLGANLNLATGARLNNSPLKEKLLTKLTQTINSIGKLGLELESKAQKAVDESEKTFLRQMSARLFEIQKIATSDQIVYELSCFHQAQGCVTWTLRDNQIAIRFGIGIESNNFPNWSDLEWLELITHELNHAFDILNAHQKGESLRLIKTESNSYLLSGMIYWNAQKDYPKIEKIQLWQKKMNNKKFAEQKDFLESNVQLFLNTYPYYRENRDEFAYLPTVAVGGRQ